MSEVEKKKKKIPNANSLANLTPGNDKDRYKPEYCTEIVSYMRNGYSLSSFGDSIGVTLSTLKNWTKKYPNFCEAHELGQQAAMKFFETMLISAAMGVIPFNLKRMGVKKLDLTAIIFVLKTRFHRFYNETKEDDTIRSTESNTFATLEVLLNNPELAETIIRSSRQLLKSIDPSVKMEK